MKPVLNKSELLNIPTKSRIITESNVMFLDDNDDFHWYKHLYKDRYIDVDFVIECRQNKIKLF